MANIGGEIRDGDLLDELHIAVTEELIRQKPLVSAEAFPDGYWLVSALAPVVAAYAKAESSRLAERVRALESENQILRDGHEKVGTMLAEFIGKEQPQ